MFFSISAARSADRACCVVPNRQQHKAMTALAKAIDLEGRFRIASEFFPGPVRRQTCQRRRHGFCYRFRAPFCRIEKALTMLKYPLHETRKLPKLF
jgi:hypothetical protein